MTKRCALIFAAFIGMPLVSVAQAAPPPVAESPPQMVAVNHRLTLLTGDIVEFTETTSRQRAVAITAAPRLSGASVVFETIGGRDSLYVIPSDAQPYLASGVLDRALFDVVALTRQGFASAKSDTMPLLLGFSGQRDRGALARDASALPGSVRTVPVPTRNLAGVRIKHDRIGEFWQAVAPQAAQHSAAQGPGKSKATLSKVSRIALDRTVRVSLDESAAMVGATAAWASGLDGRGVTVAVVDSGIDTTHPDFEGKIIDSANFTEEPDVTDMLGHGTHVASIITGSGAASELRYKGVAPGVKLVIAKVFDASGFAQESTIMAGMEWAASKGAKVINMSLGAGPTDGTDEMSLLVNDLTERTNSLFVVSAGNFGGYRSVSSPGTATSALTVGAVDKQDKLGQFSSAGPRMGDAGVKPEIVAPGVDITAARAAGTFLGEPVDDYYTTSSGTSMAAPHVAGAAAILAQQHPNWSATRLKDVLVSTAKDVGQSWHVQGAGRLDLTRARTQQITGPASVNFGQLYSWTPPTSADVLYTNDSATAITLNLTTGLKGWNQQPLASGAFKLGASILQVPAHGTAKLAVTVNPAIGLAGVYGGTITAKSADGSVLVRTPLSWYIPTPNGTLTVKLLDSQGQVRTDRTAAVLNEASGNSNDPLGPDMLQFIPAGVGTQLPQGRYTVASSVREATLGSHRWTAVVATNVALSAANSVTLDARSATRVAVNTPTPTEQRDRTVALRRNLPDTSLFVEWQFVIGADSTWDVYATPAAPAALGTVSFQDYWTLSQRQLEMKVRGSAVLRPLYDASTIGSTFAGTRALPVVWAGSGLDFTGIDVNGKLALVGIPNPGNVADPVTAVTNAAKAAAIKAAAAGAAALAVYTDVAGALPIAGLVNTPLVQLSLSKAEGQALRNLLGTTPTMIDFVGLTMPGFMYNLNYYDSNGIPSSHVRLLDPTSLVRIPTRYHADKPDIRFAKQWTAYPPLPGSFSQRTTTWTGAGEWTEYIGPGDSRVAWQRRITQSMVDSRGRTTGQLTMFAENIFRPGEQLRSDERWFNAPLRNGAVTLQSDHPVHNAATTSPSWSRACGFCRGGDDPDLFQPAMEWMDSGRGHFVTIWQNGLQYFATTTVNLYQQDGTEVPRDDSTPYRTYPVFKMPSEPGLYKLRMVDQLPAEQRGGPSQALSRTATRTETVWSFTSRRPTVAIPSGYACADKCAFQPLVQLNYQLMLDLANQAKADSDFKFTLYAGDRPDADGTSATGGLILKYSTNEGATWQTAIVTKAAAGHYLVTVHHPALADTSGYVWLKAYAWDSAGNWVEQTVTRAYGLKS